ncbi:hypothetical protein AKO1_007551, partial [Acrasis kona]
MTHIPECQGHYRSYKVTTGISKVKMEYYYTDNCEGSSCPMEYEYPTPLPGYETNYGFKTKNEYPWTRIA